MSSDCPGWWLNESEYIDRTRQMSSAIVCVCGSRSEISMPHCPDFENSRAEASTCAFFLMKASCKCSVISGGSD